jgi:hypothetical protein
VPDRGFFPGNQLAVSVCDTPRNEMPSLFGKRSSPKKGTQAVEVDETGRPHLLRPPTQLKRSFSDSARQRRASFDEELQLSYGFWQLEPSRALDALSCDNIVRACGDRIKSTSLEEPLLFSSRAMDLDSEGVATLIRAYTKSDGSFQRNLAFANPHDLAGMIKWALARFVSTNGSHGILSFQVFERWRLAEREAGFQPSYIRTHLLNLLPSSTAQLLTTLFSLLTSCLAYTSSNGATCAAHKACQASLIAEQTPQAGRHLLQLHLRPARRPDL